MDVERLIVNLLNFHRCSTKLLDKANDFVYTPTKRTLLSVGAHHLPYISFQCPEVFFNCFGRPDNIARPAFSEARIEAYRSACHNGLRLIPTLNVYN
jgi:hypothetical protein